MGKLSEDAGWEITRAMLEAGCDELFAAAPNYDLSAHEKRSAFARALCVVFDASENADIRALALSVAIQSSRL
jgi:hypothetical protein